MAFAISISSFFLFLRFSSASEWGKSEGKALSNLNLDRRVCIFFCIRRFYLTHLYCKFVLVLTTNNDFNRRC